jgi:two-component sensor histidine kinase
MLEQKTEHLEAALSELQEKNQTIQILMKELNHRVGNNLQLIYSLLNMQEMEIPDQKARQSISQAKNRILAISLLHQKLYRSEQSHDIDLPAYISELCRFLVQDVTPPVDMKISFQPPDYRSDIKASIHIGLIINEIITNALKHAWLPAHMDRQIVVHGSVEDNNRLELIMTDNGKGFIQKKDALPDSRFGLRFVQSVLDQYSGKMNLNSQSGGVVEIGMTLS